MNGTMKCVHCQARFQVLQQHGATHVACPRCHQVQPIQTLIHAADSSPHEHEQDAHPQAGRLIEWVAQYLPSWGTSVLLHMALLLVCMAATWVILSDPPTVDVQSRVIAVERRNLTYEPVQSTASPYEAEAEVGTFTMIPTNRPVADLRNNRLKPTEFISPNAGSNDWGGMPGWSPKRGAAAESMFGGNPNGMSATAKIVYIVDRSGSMTDSFMPVQKELQQAIDRLKGGNQFHVIFYSDGPGLEMPTRRLLPATTANKQAAFEFISQTYPQGGTDPADALNRAFQLKPDIIYLLSDGEFSPEIITQIRRLNGDKRVVIHTICFIYTMGEKALMTIAGENGGTYKYIDARWVIENVR